MRLPTRGRTAETRNIHWLVVARLSLAAWHTYDRLPGAICFLAKLRGPLRRPGGVTQSFRRQQFPSYLITKASLDL